MKWYLEPSVWAADWCPINCTNKMASYAFGEAIFEWTSNNNNNKNTDTIVIIIIVILLVVICIVVVFMIKNKSNNTKSKNKIAKENTSLLEN